MLIELKHMGYVGRCEYRGSDVDSPFEVERGFGTSRTAVSGGTKFSPRPGAVVDDDGIRTSVEHFLRDWIEYAAGRDNTQVGGPC